MFDTDRHVIKGNVPPTEGEYYVYSDYGIQNPNVFLLWCKERGTNRWICLKEDYYSGRKEMRQLTDNELVDRLDAMLGGIKPKQVIIDPSAASMVAALRRRGYHTRKADNEVLLGISDTCQALQDGKIAFSGECKNAIAEFGSYLWDSKAAEKGIDAVIKENDHAMDAIRYFVRTMNIVQKAGRKSYRSILP